MQQQVELDLQLSLPAPLGSSFNSTIASSNTSPKTNGEIQATVQSQQQMNGLNNHKDEQVEEQLDAEVVFALPAIPQGQVGHSIVEPVNIMPQEGEGDHMDIDQNHHDRLQELAAPILPVHNQQNQIQELAAPGHGNDPVIILNLNINMALTSFDNFQSMDPKPFAYFGSMMPAIPSLISIGFGPNTFLQWAALSMWFRSQGLGLFLYCHTFITKPV